MREFSLKHKFLIITIMAFAIVGPLVFYITQSQLRSFILSQTRDNFRAEIQAKAQRILALEKPTALKANPKINDFLTSVSGETTATQIKLIDSNGSVIAAQTPSEVGQNLNDLTKVQDALGGKSGSDNLDLTAKTETEYIPLTSPTHDVRGVLVAQIELGTSLDYVNRFVLILDGLIGLVSLVFALSMYFVFSSAEADMMEKDHSLVDQSKAFEEEKQLDEAIMSSLAEALAVINKDGQIMLFNPETEKLTGYASSEVEYRLYRKILMFVDKDGHEIGKNPIAECLKTAAPVSVSIKDGYFLKNAKKELVPVVVSAAPILNKDKEVQGVAVTIQDVSTEKELNAVKDEFVYVVAHELGNPIFALDGYLSIIEDQSKGASKSVKEMLSSARAVNTQLSDLVNDLLEVTRNEQGRLEFELAPVDLSKTIETVVQNAQFKAKAKKITLKYTPTKVPNVKANEQKIKEVLTNFIDNAVKYSPEGGKVTVSQSFADGEVTTSVTDTGFGISKADQEKLFTKFYRVKTDKTANISGTGLGLFICRQIVEKCGGRVWAESQEGKGSTFSFALPTAKK